MNTTANTNTKKMNQDTKANLIAFGIMAVIVAVGILYGMELDKIGY